MIQISSMNKIYQSNYVQTSALIDVNLEIKQGEFLMIQGQSGSGKTTLLNILGLMDKATNGRYQYKGKDVTKFRKKEITQFRNKEIGFIFQNYNLINTMNVLDNIEVPLGYRGICRKERREVSQKMLGNVGLEKKGRNYPTQLSGGEQQRVAFARALIGDPNLILADEPTGNLDSVTSEDIMKLLIGVHKQGKTIVMITHNNELTVYATRVLTIMDGKLT